MAIQLGVEDSLGEAEDWGVYTGGAWAWWNHRAALPDLVCLSVTRSAFLALDICAVGTDGHAATRGRSVMSTGGSGQGHSQEGQSPQCEKLSGVRWEAGRPVGG